MQDRMLPLIAGCLVALVSALGVVLARKPVHGAVALLVHSLSIAGLYLALSAELVAMGQVIIYSGAIVVLFLFVVLLLPHGGSEKAASGGRMAAALLGGALLLAGLLLAISAAPRLSAPPPPPPSRAGAADVGRALFGAELVPFELTAILLLVAIVGAVTLWRRQEAERA